MLQEMKKLAREKNSCVLATILDTKPYCSLMAYVTNNACTEIYMVTRKSSQKFRNLLPLVELTNPSEQTAAPEPPVVPSKSDTADKSDESLTNMDGLLQSLP